MKLSRHLLLHFFLILVPASLFGQYGAGCGRLNRYDLSPVASQVLTSIEQSWATTNSSPVSLGQIPTFCNRLISVQVNGNAIFTEAKRLIAAADHEVDIAFYKWDPSTEGSYLIGQGLIEAQARRTPGDPLLVRILFDGSAGDIATLSNSWLLWGLDPNRVVLQFGLAYSFLAAPPGVLHDKLIVVDGTTTLITGAMPQPAHQAPNPWHDAAYAFEGDIALSSLANFDQSWDEAASYWSCPPYYSYSGCTQGWRPSVYRPWLRQYGMWRPGSVPILAVGRKRFSYPNNDTSNPQDVAWLTLMDSAVSHIDVETPNINDNAFQTAILDAVARGVTVRLITSLGFNDGREDLVTQGGDNQEVAGNLRKWIRANAPWYQDRFQLRWHSLASWSDPIGGNGPGASHTKYMSVDDRYAIVGSGNMDTLSWNYSHEFNFLVDDTAATSTLQNALFLPDWSRATTSYLELYEGNDATQDVVCPLPAVADKALHFDDGLINWNWDSYRCNNDEARSALLHDLPAGRVIRFYDDPQGRPDDDDWTEIRVKRFVSRKVLSTFEQTFEDDDVRMIHHRNNGLDGKISFARIDYAQSGGVVDLYEGNSGTQNLVCSIPANGTRSIDLTSDSHCNNDEARSLVLYDFPANLGLLIYDSPSGSTGDDWTVIVPKRTIYRALVPTFEAAADTADLRICHAHHNGLDGKVSRLRIVPLAEAAAYCSLPPVQVSVVRAGTGSGTVTSSPAGLSCGSTCAAPFAAQSVVTLQASPSPGSSFAGWSGACSGTGACTLSLSSSVQVTATFTVNAPPPAGCGEGSCVAAQGMYVSHFSGLGCTGTESYYLPYDGYAYACRTWDGSGQCGTIRRTVTSTSVRINGGACQDLWTSGNTLSDFVTVYRGGTPPPPPPPAAYTLTVAKSGTGAGTVAANAGSLYCGSACSASYTQGSQVLLSATAAAGSVFAGWSGAGCSGTSTSCLVTVGSNLTAQAAFNAAGGGSCGEGSCVAAQGAYVSHFTGPNCTGTESYYTPYDGYAYACRSWDGGGTCGTVRRTVTNVSYRLNGNPCVGQAWPQGNTLSEFVTIYR